MSSLESICFGLIGCGGIGRRHAEAITHIEGAKLAWVTDPVKDSALTLAGQFHAAYEPDCEALVHREGVDAVIVASPSGLHAEQALLAVRAGRHVLVEKPLALSYEQGWQMITEAEKAHVVLGVVHPLRFMPMARHLKKLVTDGKLGEVSHASVKVRWNRNTEYFLSSPWRGTSHLDGGMLLNQAIHHIDLLWWYLGDVARVSAEVATRCHQIEIEDVAVANLRFANGALGSVEVTTNVYPTSLEEEVAIFGERGTVVVGGGRIHGLRVWRVQEEPPEDRVLQEFAGLPPREPWHGHYEVLNDFCRALREGRDPELGGRQAWSSLSIVLAAYESSATGRAVEPPAFLEMGATGEGDGAKNGQFHICYCTAGACLCDRPLGEHW